MAALGERDVDTAAEALLPLLQGFEGPLAFVELADVVNQSAFKPRRFGASSQQNALLVRLDGAPAHRPLSERRGTLFCSDSSTAVPCELAASTTMSDGRSPASPLLIGNICLLLEFTVVPMLSTPITTFVSQPRDYRGAYIECRRLAFAPTRLPTELPYNAHYSYGFVFCLCL